MGGEDKQEFVKKHSTETLTILKRGARGEESSLDQLKTILIKKIKPCLSDVSTLFSQGEEKTKER